MNSELPADFGYSKRERDPAWQKVEAKVMHPNQPIPKHKPKKKKQIKEVKPFHAFKGDSTNAKATISNS